MQRRQDKLIRRRKEEEVKSNAAFDTFLFKTGG
jgi:hypothetical protein